MNKPKFIFIYVLSGLMYIWWVVTIAMGTREELTNYLWQAGLAVSAISYAALGLYTSKHWGGLRSGVGKGVFFIALGMLTWGLGQAGWTYFTLAQPDVEVPNAPILDFLYFATVPIWTYGILQLSKATGAKYGLRTLKGKLFALSVFIATSVLSYFMLIVVARGGFNTYFDTSTLPADSLPMWWIAFTDLGYALGDAVNLALAVSIFGLSWKYLGGRFRVPIVVILFAFGLMYIADFFFSYYDGLGTYFNGHWVDLVYLSVVTILAIALLGMDPKSFAQKTVATQTIAEPAEENIPVLQTAAEPVSPPQIPAQPQVITNTPNPSDSTPAFQPSVPNENIPPEIANNGDNNAA